MILTIQQFSEKTGLPPSTLRFYDRKQLLKPESRLANGYRAYHTNQITDALMIHSLRNADIPIEEIKSFLTSHEEQKQQFLAKWKEDVQSKLEALTIAKQYLTGMNIKENHLYLVKWDEPFTIVWFQHTVKRKIQPFHDVVEKDLHQLKSIHNNLSSSFLIKYLTSKGKEVTGENGFIVRDWVSNEQLPEHAYSERWEPTLFASMECSVENEFICFQFIQMIKQYGFIPNGTKFEKYESIHSQTFHYLIPLLKSQENLI